MNNKINYEEFATKMLNSKDLTELADYLQGFLCVIQPFENKEEAFEEIIKIIEPYYERYTSNKVNNPYIILKGKKAVVCFLWLIWPHTGDSEERFKELERQSNTIRLMIRKPFSKERLEPDAIDSVMKIVDGKLSYSNILRKYCLKILLLNNSHGMFNSFALSQMMPSGRRDDAIVIPCKNPLFPYSQKISLVHELGHILHFRMTGTSNELPPNFRCIQEIMFRGSLDAPKEDICEIFADCFAFAAICGTPLENESVLKSAHENDKKILEKYFCDLFNLIKEYIEQNTKQT